ncbi:MAG TPA: [Fe-Fe] hydrogenase large subunit C-terminal domain-containing protein [Clostridia bacterium]|nr:[Fe-Fe] hydrogenase large subunit C-terminal domain-containing protein [Clostridia bacterium]
MQEYFHSVTLDEDKCMGCTNCIKRCPTEAIRVRDGKAYIIAERCIDCGECIRVCPYHAKIAVTDSLDSIDKHKYKIALPAPTLYGQFEKLTSIDSVLHGLKALGFDDVFEVARGADYVTEFTKYQIEHSDPKWPIISSACPAVVRLVQVGFPELINNLADVQSPMEIAAQIAKDEFSREHGVDEDEIGAFFITPCAAKATSIRNPLGAEKSSVDGAISILDIYGPLSLVMNREGILNDSVSLQKSTLKGVGWANSGGEGTSLGIDSYLAVNGIHNVMRVLEEIENGKLSDLDFFEGLACVGGCVGGPLVFENNFVAQNRLKNIISRMEPPAPITHEELERAIDRYNWILNKEILPKPIMILDEDISSAIKKMGELERIYADLPGLDCGSCGSPSCRTLAEDIVRGYATEFDCVIKLREKVKNLAREVIELSDNLPTGRERRGTGGLTHEDKGSD